MEIASIVYKPDLTQEDSLDAYLRVPLESATLSVGQGIQGDRKGRHPTRQLNIMSFETLEALRAEGFSTQPGQMGEQIVIRGLEAGSLAEGDRLQIGEQAWVEVVNHRTGCDRFERIQGRPRTQAAGRLGVIARVVAGGPVRVGDPVRLVRAEAQPA